MKTSNVRHQFHDDKLDVRLLDEGERLLVELQDRATGRVWGPTPLVALDVHQNPLRRENRIDRYKVEAVHSLRCGAHVVISDAAIGVTVGFRMLLDRGELAVRLVASEVYEAFPVHYRVFTVDVLPELMTVKGTGATLMLPVNGATLCRPANKPKAADRFMIYLEQPRWELTSMLPIAAAWDGGAGLMALASESAPEAQCRIGTDGEGSGRISLAFSLRRFWPDAVEPARREVRILPIAMSKSVDPIHFVAKRLRRHAMEDHGKARLKDRAKASPEIAHLLKATQIKLFHGMQHEGWAISDPLPHRRPHEFINTMTFAEAGECLTKLKNLGVDRIGTLSVGWNARGHDGLYPTRFPIEERLGGEEGFREMLKLGAELGYHCSVHDNFQMNVPQSPDWDPDTLVHDMFGEPLMRGWWAGGNEYATWPLALPEEKVGGHLRRMKDLGIQGTYYCDYWMSPLEVNYHPRHKGSRSAHQRGMDRVLREARNLFSSVGTEFGTFPGVLACDAIAITLPHGYRGAVMQRPEWPITALLDESVPVWGLALHDLVTHQAGGSPTWRNVMYGVAWGGLPRDEWGVRPIAMGGIHVFDDRRAVAIKAQHDLCIGRFGNIVSEEMTRCVLTGSTHVRTSFADGTEVEADFESKQLKVNGKTVERPEMLLTDPA